MIVPSFDMPGQPFSGLLPVQYQLGRLPSSSVTKVLSPLDNSQIQKRGVSAISRHRLRGFEKQTRFFSSLLFSFLLTSEQAPPKSRNQSQDLAERSGIGWSCSPEKRRRDHDTNLPSGKAR